MQVNPQSKTMCKRTAKKREKAHLLFVLHVSFLPSQQLSDFYFIFNVSSESYTDRSENEVCLWFDCQAYGQRP